MIDFSNLNPQPQSPLYKTLAPELRLAIYEFVLAAYPSDLSALQYSFDSFYYRPGYTSQRVTDVRVLSVCKRVYQEACDLVFVRGTGNDEEAFWWGSMERRPSEYRYYTNGLPQGSPMPRRERRRANIDETSPFQTARAFSFLPAQWQKITTIHIFPQMFTFSPETFAKFFDAAPFLRPRVVKVTFRYTDWWWWENNTKLKLDIGPRKIGKQQEVKYYFPESVEEFILELETIESKRKELDEEIKIVLGAKQEWKWRRLDGEFLSLDKDRTDDMVLKDEETWMGTTRPGNQFYFHHPSECREMVYVVKTLRFKAPKSIVEGDVRRFSEIATLK